MKTYSLFGISISTNFKFVSKLTKGHNRPDITFKVLEKPPIEVTWSSEIPQYSSSRNGFKKGNFFIYHLKKWDVLRFTSCADYYINNNQIICHLHNYKYHPSIEIQFLGIVLSYWLESQGILALHASAVNINGKAISFLSSNKGGKTSIAASLMQKGYPLITDDILPLDITEDGILCRSGYPTMRMWPEEAEYFLGDSKNIPLVHPELSKKRVFVGSNDFGSFFSKLSELSSIYIPKRSHETTTEIKIKTLPPVEGFLELVKHSFTPYLVEAVGWQQIRLQKFTQIIKEIPVKNLIYPHGYEHLPKLCESILNDIQSL